MKVLLCTLNAKYIHSSLALAYLKESCRSDAWEIILSEYTINEKNQDIMSAIFLEKADIICFSCYIWNIEAILEICNDYKKVSPDTVIILGGPEVSFNARQLLAENEAVDIIVRGEGEYCLNKVLEHLSSNRALTAIKGISYRENGSVLENEDQELIADLDLIPPPYKENMEQLKNKLVYYETSRGCPFNCAYCLSSTIKGVRFFSLPRVKRDLRYLIEQGIKKIKFVDRTFNCNEKRSKEIMQFIIGQQGTSRFHFEICADLLSPEMLDFLAQVPPDLFDFEIGIQSTCNETLRAVNRKSDWSKLRNNILQLLSAGNIHIHLDLIAGLPEESYERFGRSFNDVYELNPHVIQLGFLKMLKGSNVRSLSAKYGYKFQEKPPYQVLSHDCLSYEEIIKLGHIEDLLDRYFNSKNMENSIAYIINRIYSGNAFKFYESLASYWEEKELFSIGHKRETEYRIINDYSKAFHSEHQTELNELLKYDYFLNNKSYQAPAGIVSHNPEKINEILYACLKDENFVSERLPFLLSRTVREIRRQVHLEYFSYDPIEHGYFNRPRPFLFVYDNGQKKARQVISL